MNKISIAKFSELKPLDPTYALVAGVDLVVIRWQDDDAASVLYGRCAHQPN
ncbi:MAG: hypothetical protein GY935_24940 [Gammaproteobacteria bacterium]|nr:hypothetical protein [Gammaproteobacteria bacterium]